MSAFEWSVGDRVQITRFPYAGRPGRLAQRVRIPGLRVWTIELLDTGPPTRRVRVLERGFRPWIPLGSTGLMPGTRVGITAPHWYGLTGVLERRTRTLWARSWIVAFDHPRGIKRARIAERELVANPDD
jgi:hypothetical protein